MITNCDRANPPNFCVIWAGRERSLAGGVWLRSLVSRARRWLGLGRVAVACLVLLPLALVLHKLVFLNYQLADVLPTPEYRVSFDMSLDGHGEAVKVRTFSPPNNQHQSISEERQETGEAFRFSSEGEDQNRVVTWLSASAPDQAEITYSFSALTTAVEYDVDPGLAVPDGYPDAVARELRPTDTIQVDDPAIRARLKALGADRGSVLARLRRIFDFSAGLTSRPFKGTTDALTALKLGEASCNGKSRLFVALARAAGIPARLVGGLILTPGEKRTSHQWTEAYIGGHWVPFCPTNGHFASLPADYLELYRGDEALFVHTSDINFDYSLATASRLVPSPRVRETFRAFNVWDLFARLRLPFSLLRTVLMLPIGALVVVLFRNVVGVPTFGTFLPALIASAAGETGLGWGLLSLLAVWGVLLLSRRALESLGLLHSPTLAILLAVVVITMLGLSLVADAFGATALTRVSYFPIAVMAIASERLYLALAEQGPRSAAAHLVGTLLVVSGCYVVMSSLALQVLISGFPEILLLVIAADIYLGRWVGVRLLELWRFRRLIRMEARP